MTTLQETATYSIESGNVDGDNGNAPLGLDVIDRTLDDGTKGVFIRAFRRPGLAFDDGRLFTNDRLLCINNVSLEGM